MKKLISIVLIILLSACSNDVSKPIIPNDEVDQTTNLEVQPSSSNETTTHPVETVPVTFHLICDEELNLVLGRRGIDDIYEAVDVYALTYKDGIYSTTINIQPNTLFEYMYIQDMNTNRSFEKNAIGQDMYRTLYVTDSIEVTNQWSKENLTTTTITVLSDNVPVRDLVVDTDGLRRITMQDGTTIMDHVKIGSLVTVYDLEGRYQPQTVILEEKTTVNLEPSEFTTVTFKVQNNAGIDLLRVAGMIGEMGYKYLQENRRYFDGDGRQLLELTEQDGYFIGQMELPINQVLTYTYTVGTNRIGSEKDDWAIVTRDILIKPNLIINDTVTNFKRPNEVYVTFDPDYDQRLDLRFEHLSVSFVDKITVPVTEGSVLKYRYQTSAEDFTSEFLGNRSLDQFGYNEYRILDPVITKTLHDSITEWTLYQDSNIHANIPVDVRSVFTGIMMFDYWTSTDYDDFEEILPTLEKLNPDYIFLSPIWNYSDIVTHPKLEATGHAIGSVAIPDVDLRHVLDVTTIPIGLHQQENPEMTPNGMEDYFAGGGKSDEWWAEYLSEVRRFVMYYAEVAEEYHLEFFKFPDTFVGETLGNFSNYDQVIAYDEYMNELLSDVREVYSGKIYAPVIIYSNFDYHYTYLEHVDYLSNKHWYDPTNLPQAEARFKEELAQYHTASLEYGKPYMIDQIMFMQDNLTVNDSINELIPAFYDKMFSIINEESWIEGVVLFGYPYVEGGSMIVTANTVIEEWFEAFK